MLNHALRMQRCLGVALTAILMLSLMRDVEGTTCKLQEYDEILINYNSHVHLVTDVRC